MTTIKRVDVIPVKLHFSFETYDGKKYVGPLDKKDLIIKWIIKYHRDSNSYPRHVYLSLDEFFISPVLFLPEDMLTEVAKYIETPRLPKFLEMTKNMGVNRRDRKRFENLSLEPKKMFREFGRANDTDSFYELMDINHNYRDIDEFPNEFVKGMLEGKHYHDLYLFVKHYNGSVMLDDSEIMNDIHSDAFQMILVNFRFLYFESYYTYESDDPLTLEEWDAFFDFRMTDEDIINTIVSAGFVRRSNMNDEIIDFIIKKRPSLVEKMFSVVLGYYLEDAAENRDVEESAEDPRDRYFRLLKKYSHLVNINDIEMNEDLREYGLEHGMFK